MHTYDEATADRLLGRHELAGAGVLRHMRLRDGAPAPARQRNVGWREARAPLIAFTDDDCRPVPRWLATLLSHARADAVVQGATQPDPAEAEELAAAHVRTLLVDPPGRDTQTCNILYERALLERLGGFDEDLIVGEDIDLGLRARRAGATVVGAPAALVYHAIEPLTLAEKIRANEKWQHLALLVKKHPELRRDCELGIWWKPEHLRAVVALVALAGVSRRPWLVVGVLPYAALEPERGRYGPTRRDRLRAARRMPQYLLVDLAEVATFLRGSIRHRSLLL